MDTVHGVFLGPSAQNSRKTTNTIGDTTLIVKPQENSNFLYTKSIEQYIHTIIQATMCYRFAKNINRTHNTDWSTCTSFLHDTVSWGNYVYQQLGPVRPGQLRTAPGDPHSVPISSRQPCRVKPTEIPIMLLRDPNK